MRLQRIYLNTWGWVCKPGAKARRMRERYAACCTDVIVTINGARHKKWRTFLKVADYVKAFAHFRALGVRVHVMSWIRPDLHGWIEPMVKWLRQLRAACITAGLPSFSSVLLDAEGQWSRGWPFRRPKRRAAREREWRHAAYNAHSLLQAAGFRVGVTDVPMVDWGVVEALFAGADYAMPQAHEFANWAGVIAASKLPPKERVKPRRIRKPGRLVSWTYKVWPKRLTKRCKLIPHLAFYSVQTQRSVRTSIETAIGHGATDVSGWTGRKFRCRAARKVLAAFKAEITAAQAAKELSA